MRLRGVANDTGSVLIHAGYRIAGTLFEAIRKLHLGRPMCRPATVSQARASLFRPTATRDRRRPILTSMCRDLQ